MTFSSLAFFAFLAVVYVLYRLSSFRLQHYVLLLASFFFYGWSDVRFLYLLTLSATIDFCIGMMLGNGRIPLRVRLHASAWLIGAALLCIGVQWSAVRWSFHRFAVVVDWKRLVPFPSSGGYVVAGTLLLVLIANLGYLPLSRSRHARRWLLLLTVFVNLTILGVFKYFNFFVTSTEQLLGGLGIQTHFLHVAIVLPLGISFYTFESMSYCFDVDKGLLRPANRLSDYLLFVTYFPHLVAGPIVRAKTLLVQLTTPRRLDLDGSLQGLYLILFGLFKKIAIADGVALSVASIYGSTGKASATDIIVATLLFAAQIYCDFSGYSDIAIGVSKLFGIDIPVNFAFPYFSTSPREFWQRWHISLSSWLRDYLYIPLGGSATGPVKTYRNLMFTMLLGGLWHGAAWNFVLWGGYQGLLLCTYRLAGDRRPALPRPDSLLGTWTSAVQTLVFFILTCYGWLLFRSTSLAQIVDFTGTLLGSGPTLPSILKRPTFSALCGIPLLAGLDLLGLRSGTVDLHRGYSAPMRGAVYAALIVLTLMGAANAPEPFIYFRF